MKDQTYEVVSPRFIQDTGPKITVSLNEQTGKREASFDEASCAPPEAPYFWRCATFKDGLYLHLRRSHSNGQEKHGKPIIAGLQEHVDIVETMYGGKPLYQVSTDYRNCILCKLRPGFTFKEDSFVILIDL